MILIPNYCPSYTSEPHTSASIIFDYMGTPYGFDTSYNIPKLDDDFASLWLNYLGVRPFYEPVYPHRMM